MVQFNIKSNQYEVAKKLKEREKKTPQVIAKAINYSVSDVRDLLQKRIQEAYAIKSTGFRKAWKRNKIDKATAQKTYATIHVKGKRLSMDYFILKPSKRPKKQPEYYTGKFLVNTAMHNLVSNTGMKGFLARMENGYSGIFYRLSKTNRKLGEITAPSLPIMVKDEQNVNSIVRPKIQEIVDKNIKKLIEKMGG